MELIQIAKLNKTFGLKGEFKAYCLTDFPTERFKIGTKMYFQNPKSKELKPVTLASYRKKDEFVIIRFEEFPSINDIEPFLGFDLMIEKEQATLPKDTYHVFDLIGCKAYSQDGQEIGEVIDVFSYSPIKNLRIKRNDDLPDVQVPFVNSFIKEINLDSKRIVINVIEGLL